MVGRIKKEKEKHRALEEGGGLKQRWEREERGSELRRIGLIPSRSTHKRRRSDW